MRAVRLMFVGTLLMLSATQGLAANTRSSGGTVIVNELEVLTLKSGSTSSRKSRAQYVAGRIRPLTKDSSVAVVVEGKAVSLVSGKYVIMNVISAEARAHATSGASLANLWAQNIKRALAVPPLTLNTDRVVLPPGGGLTVEVTGSESSEFAVQVQDKSIATARRTVAGVRLDGLSLGKTSVNVTSKSEKVTLNVTVAPYAANFPQSGSVTITGDPTLEDTLRGAIDGAVRTQLQTQPGADLSYSIASLPKVHFDESILVPVRVKATGDALFESEGLFNVTVRNLPIGYRPEAELWYCNDPENIKAPGQLFAAYLNKSEPARILYHHINDSWGGLYVGIQMVNESDAPARVMVIPGESRPDKNPVLAGYVAAEQFVKGWSRYSGEVVTVPPKSALPLAWRRLAPQETLSGLAYIRLIDGPERLLVRTDAVSPELVNMADFPAAGSAPWRTSQANPLSRESERFTLSQHIYPKPFKVESLTYTVGGNHGFVRIGQRPIERADRLSYLAGNFGVMYTIQARIDNPTVLPATVEAVFEASAGYTGAIFLVNGEIRAMRLLQPKEEVRILSTQVGAGAFQDVRIVTLPLSGSSYPATITFRTVPTQVLSQSLRDRR